MAVVKCECEFWLSGRQRIGRVHSVMSLAMCAQTKHAEMRWCVALPGWPIWSECDGKYAVEAEWE
jgi:hypothetical protein